MLPQRERAFDWGIVSFLHNIQNNVLIDAINYFKHSEMSLTCVKCLVVTLIALTVPCHSLAAEGVSVIIFCALNVCFDL